MKPAQQFAARMRTMTDAEAMAYASRLAADAGLIVPVGKTGKTTLRIVSRSLRLTVREYGSHKTTLFNQLALLGA